ncbi:hypothetical protein [Metapseudomonas otitidis]|uniref:hypothetical protein n=1 Tax=Metapseudomonas otitidis TaxID=319939 RepID=UPI0013F5EA42|nr:hypothetical protein [Pseudomonas otitidis]
MKSYLTTLENKRITDVYKDSELTGFLFEDTSKLSIFNKHKLSSSNPKNLIGEKIESIAESEKMVRLELEGGAYIEIYLDSPSWTGPEAIELVLPDGKIIIWN